MSRIIRRHFVFYGRVQGVGFRWRAHYAAELNNVTGYVKNLYDSSVEMEAEGYEENIDKMIMELESGRFIRIENMEVRDIPPTDSRSFVID